MTPQDWTNMSIAFLLLDVIINFAHICWLRNRVEKLQCIVVTLEKRATGHNLSLIAATENYYILQRRIETLERRVKA